MAKAHGGAAPAAGRPPIRMYSTNTSRSPLSLTTARPPHLQIAPLLELVVAQEALQESLSRRNPSLTARGPLAVLATRSVTAQRAHPPQLAAATGALMGLRLCPSHTCTPRQIQQPHHAKVWLPQRRPRRRAPSHPPTVVSLQRTVLLGRLVPALPTVMR